jgi:carboxypeptidase Q
MKRTAALFLLLLLVLPCNLLAQTASPAPISRSTEDKRAYREAMEAADQKIQAEIRAHSELMKNLEYLTTNIGARLTGSPGMQKASQWTLERFHDYGLDAHLESVEIPHAYNRGQDWAALVAPVARGVPIHALGWSKPTSGEVSGDVVIVTAKREEDLGAEKSKLKGAVVLFGEPTKVPPDDDHPDNAYDAVIAPERGVPEQGSENSSRQRRALLRAIAAEQPAAIILDSGKTDNLFNMGGASFGGRSQRYQASAAPVAFITHEDYALISRLAKAGAVRMKVNLTGTLAGPAPAAITVAEIKGSELPEERVIIGGHLDSWDLGTGALDNGTGAMAVLEAARALKALGWKPQRTLTFILFTGEEQGSIGASTFLKKHEAETSKIDGLLVHDTGTGRVFSIALENLWTTAPLMHEIYQPLEEVFDLEPLSSRYFGSSDHVPFLRQGIPAYFCVQRPAHYREAHHSQTDTFDKVLPNEINQGAAVLAAWMWNVSQMPPPLPHHEPTPEPSE